MIARHDMQMESSMPLRRAKLIELLNFARTEIKDRLELDACPHGGWFASEDERCWSCAASQECAWLLHNDGVLPWDARDDADLLMSLKFALETIDIQVRNREHHIQVCNCDTCAWVRSTRYFLANHR